MFNWSIRGRLVFISTALLALLVASNLYLGQRLSVSVDALASDEVLVTNLRSAIATSKAFGDLKYWLLELAVSPRSRSHENAQRARDQVVAELDNLNRFDAEAVAVLRLEVGALMDTTLIAMEAYEDSQPAMGDAFLAKGLDHIRVVDRRLADMVRGLEVEVADRRVVAVAGGTQAATLSRVIALTGVVLGFALTVAVVRSIIVPLRRLMKAMQRITAGDLDVRMPPAKRDEIGAMTRTLILFRDSLRERDRLMAEHARAEAIVHRAQARLTDAIESISEGFSLYDADDRLVMSNGRYRQLMYPHQQRVLVPGMTFEEIARGSANLGLVSDAVGRTEEWLAERLQRHREPTGPHIQRRGDGRWIQVNERKTSDGGTVAVYMDITELKRREEELAAANQAKDATLDELHTLLEAIDYGVLLLDSELRIRVSNRAYRQMWGMPDDFFAGRHPSLIEDMEWTQAQGRYGLPDEGWEAYCAQRLAEVRDGSIAPKELNLANDRVIQYECHVLPDGGRMLTYFDITDLKLRQRELAAAVREKDAALVEFHAVIDAIEDALLFMDADLRARIVNKAFKRLWQIPDEVLDTGPTMLELMEYNRGKGVYDVPPAQWDDYVQRRIDAVHQGSIPPEIFRRADGIILEYSCTALPDGGRMLMYSDITELGRTQRALRESEERYALAVKGSNDGLWDWDAKSNQIYISPSFREIAGITAEEDYILPQQWEQMIHPDDVARHRAAVRAHLQGAQEFFIAEYRVRGDDGRYRWVLIRGIGLRDESKRVYRTAGSLTDFTVRKEAEIALRDAKEQAEAATRTKSRFLATMSHELRTPLNAVIGLSEMLMEEAQEEQRSELFEPLQRILSASRHLLSLINDILDISKIEAGKLELHLDEFEVSSFMRELATTAEPLASKHGNRLELRLGDALGSARSDATRLRQILLNLLSNACKFTDNGRIGLDIRRASAGGRDWLTVEISDTGIGMSQEELDKLFVEFSQSDSSSTRKHGGAGLGLAISRHLCHLLGGRIAVRSEPGIGSLFSVTLPADGQIGEPAAA